MEELAKGRAEEWVVVNVFRTKATGPFSFVHNDSDFTFLTLLRAEGRQLSGAINSGSLCFTQAPLRLCT